MQKKESDALDFAELLIMRLPLDDAERQKWLIKNGKGLEADELRRIKRHRDVYEILLRDETVAKSITDSFGQGKSLRFFSCETDCGHLYVFEVPLWEVEEKNIPHQLPAVELIQYLK
jgi:hypothetical protein